MHATSLISATQQIMLHRSTEEIDETPWTTRSPYFKVRGHGAMKTEHDLFVFNHQGNQIILQIDYVKEHLSAYNNGLEIPLDTQPFDRFIYLTEFGDLDWHEMKNRFNKTRFLNRTR